MVALAVSAVLGITTNRAILGPPISPSIVLTSKVWSNIVLVASLPSLTVLDSLLVCLALVYCVEWKLIPKRLCSVVTKGKLIPERLYSVVAKGKLIPKRLCSVVTKGKLIPKRLSPVPRAALCWPTVLCLRPSIKRSKEEEEKDTRILHLVLV